MIILGNFVKIRNFLKQSLALTHSFYSGIYTKPFILKRVAFLMHSKDDSSNEFNLIKINQQFSYDEYLRNLKNFQWVNYQLRRITTLLKQTKDIRNEDHKHLRDSINELLLLSKFITQSRAYHNRINIDFHEIFERLPVLLRLLFSEKSNKTHENIYEQQKNTYQFIQFAYYFRLCNQWRVPFNKDILEFYLHSYMNLLFDRSLFKYLSVYEVLKQSEVTQLISDIIQKSKMGVNKLIPQLNDKIQKSSLLNPHEMGIYLKYLRNIYNNSLQQTEKAIVSDVLTTYILQSKQQWQKSVGHCENITYSLYLLLQIEKKKGYLISLIYEKFSEKIRMSRQKQDKLLIYLKSFNSHEDKITCLKIDIWLSLLQVQKQMPQQVNKFSIRSFVLNSLNGVDELNVRYWRYKYICWILDLLLNKVNSLEYIHKVCSSLQNVYLNSNENISSMAIFLNQITSKNFDQLQSIINIHYSIANWLIKLQKTSLKDQNSQDLCQILTIADRHPSLQTIYTPYLTILLQLSLGHFAWADLTKLYYYGLKFKVQDYSQEALWNMEYVRRYILNQYATMGIVRRQIPQDSYFYKIIGITTPQKFYKNYLQHNQS